MLTKYVQMHESRNLRDKFIQANVEKARRKSNNHGAQVYSITLGEQTIQDTALEMSYPTSHSLNTSERDIETAQIMSLKVSGKAFKRKEFCNNCKIEHYLFDGKCYQNQPCPLCQINGHPGDSCFQRCKLAECNKISRHHQDQCPRIKIRDEELKSMKDQNQYLRDLLTKHGITSSDSTLKE